jgi:hypothetical protein
VSARHRQHKKKLAAAELTLADREVDLVSYDRVIADMMNRRALSGSQAIVIVRVCRDAIERDCAVLREDIADLERKAVA